VSEQPRWGTQPEGGHQPGDQPGWTQPAYGPPAYGPPAYGQQPGYPPYPQYGYSAPKENDGSAIAALIASILAWVFCPIVPAVVALFLASAADRSIAASGGRKSGTGMAKAARIISWANIAFFVVLAVAGIGVAVVAARSGTATYDGGGTTF
jgi:quinol-cytochrome oxidoreductase complex cytochrome b subunit